jgi:hypothetical protein
MKIRLATRFDIPDLVRMMLDYRTQSPIEILKTSNNTEYAEQLFDHIIAGRGIVFVADRDGSTVGMLVAIRNPNIWDPSVMVMNELAYWVDPQHRHSTAGYKLLSKYREWCEQAKLLGTIQFYTISRMVNSPDLDYGRFGFRKLEESWEQ